MKSSQTTISRNVVSEQGKTLQDDFIVVEEPLQIDLIHNQKNYTFTITMRTPGQDNYLTYGLLFSEGVINQATDILALSSSMVKDELGSNVIKAELTSILTKDLENDLRRNSRSLMSYSGCGICGKTSLKALALRINRVQKVVVSQIDNSDIKKIRDLLSVQPLFSETGGSHVAGIIYEKAHNGVMTLDLDNAKFFEDVGRHNALDKLIGFELLHNNLEKPGVFVLSGRIGFELVQKVVMAGYTTIIALGAPSSLAIQAANQFGVTLIGFAKDNRFNVYTF